MARGILLVLSDPIDEHHDAEYNEWYSDIHLPEVLQLAGFVSARRFRVSEHQLASQGGLGSVRERLGHGYVAIYEVEANDLQVAVRSLGEASGALTVSPAMAYAGTTAVLLEELVSRP